jgi:hypothetical protein
MDPDLLSFKNEHELYLSDEDSDELPFKVVEE